MKIIFYNINPLEKKYLIAANKNRHQLSFCHDSLDESTVEGAKHFDVIGVSNADNVSESIIKKLKSLNARFIIVRAANCENVDVHIAKMVGMHVAAIPSRPGRSFFVKDQLEYMAAETFYNIDCWAGNRVSKNELMDPEPGHKEPRELIH